MKWLSAGLTFVNVTTVCGCLEGIAAHGLNKTVAASSAIAGLVAALLAFWGTSDSPEPEDVPAVTSADSTPQPAQVPAGNEANPSETVVVSPAPLAPAPAPLARPAPSRRRWRYQSIWLWAMVAVFAMFAIRSFCNVFFIDGNEYKIQNPNNLGDLSLHITYIKTFASGVAMWPENPIYVFSKLRYPAGIDLFNALLLCLDVSVIRGLVWVGLGSSAALCYALYRWGGTFTMAGFLFNGGLVGYQWFRNYEWKDFQSSNYIAWKSLALTMLVTQRGLLYALPAGLLLLCHWRAKFFPRDQITAVAQAPSSEPGGSEAAAPSSRGILPFWVELSLYGTMPLFHVHTFMALSFVLLFLFLFLGARARKQLFLLGALALLPATFFIWLITDHFHAGSVISWNPGWVQNNGDFARPLAAFTSQPAAVAVPVAGFIGTMKHFFEFWVINFGISLPLIIALVVLLGIRAWKQRGQPAAVNVRLVSLLGALAGLVVVLAALFAYLSLGYSLFVVLALIPPVALAVMIPLFASLLQRSWRQTLPLFTPLAFVIPAVVLFIFSCLVKTAPWEWDNIKLIIWSYLIVLPFAWSELVSRWSFPIRALVCVALFGSGFFTIFGGMAAGRTGYGMADRQELDAVGIAVSKIPLEARFAAFPTYNHPLLLQGRKLILGYPGHIWTQGFSYGDDNNKLNTLMNGAPDWKQTARSFRARYLFWGREEIKNYPQSKRPWEQESKLVVGGAWGSIYDIESPREPAPAAAPTPAAPIPAALTPATPTPATPTPATPAPTTPRHATSTPPAPRK